MTVLAWINEQTNVCENTSLDDRFASEIKVDGYLMLDLEQTPSAHWEWDESAQDWVIIQEGIGNGGIGDTYTDGMLLTSRPVAPPSEQPVTSGTQTL